MIAIMSAIPGELTLLRDLALPGTVLVESGIGKVNAAALTTELILTERPEVILFTGVAGGLDPALGVGDVVIGERTVQHDAGVMSGGRIAVHQAGHIPFFNPTDRLGYAPSPALLAAAVDTARQAPLAPVLGRHPRVEVGTILTGDVFVDDSGTRRRLHEELGGQAVEMEGAAVAQVAERHGVDCLVVRALSDLAGAGSTLDFVAFTEQVAANSARIVAGLVGRLAG